MRDEIIPSLEYADLAFEDQLKVRRAIFFDKAFITKDVLPYVQDLLMKFDPDLKDHKDWNFKDAESKATLCWPLERVDSGNLKALNDYPKTPQVEHQVSYRPQGWLHAVKITLKFHLWALLAMNKISLDLWLGYALSKFHTTP